VEAEAIAEAGVEEVVDSIAVARLYGEPLFDLPQDLYIPPDALEVFLEAFEGPLDLLLYLLRRQNFNILDIPLASVTRQYRPYVRGSGSATSSFASDYLLMAAMRSRSSRACCCRRGRAPTARSPTTRAPSSCGA
jgi:segregation and condensation protein A